MQLPVLHAWRIHAPSLPEHLFNAGDAPEFSLPGALDLLQYAELLGDSPDTDTPAPDVQTASFPLPAMLPGDLSGEVSLSCEVDFGALTGDRAILIFNRLHGSGSVFLGDVAVAAFDSAHPALMNGEKALALSASPCALALDVTDAMRRGRRETLTLRFDSVRPAGVSGAIVLQTTQDAFLCRPSITPDLSGTVTMQMQINALHAGEYVLRVLTAPPVPGSSALPAREITLTLQSEEIHTAKMTFTLPADSFIPGVPYASPSVKIQLWRIQEGAAKAPNILCDSVTLACGYPGRAPRTFVPLRKEDAAMPAQALCSLLRSMHVSGVSLRTPADEDFYRAMTRVGIGVVLHADADDAQARRLTRHPCVNLTGDAPDDKPLSLAASAWQLCGMTGQARPVDPALTDSTLLYEAAGRRLDPNDDGVHAVLQWLRSVAVRLRCEAARQQRYIGALCAPGEIHTPDIAEAIRTAFAPLHLSALPLCGAWWTGTRFSAMLEVFMPSDETNIYEGNPLSALAVLEDDDGHELARLCTPLRAKSSYVGMLDAPLPDHPCVLELRTQLLCGDDVLEETTLPVYVGERGPLEPAFAPQC